MSIFITQFRYGQPVKVTDDFCKGFYRDHPATIVGSIKDGEKFKVEFYIKHLGKSVVKIVPTIMIRGISQKYNGV